MLMYVLRISSTVELETLTNAMNVLDELECHQLYPFKIGNYGNRIT